MIYVLFGIIIALQVVNIVLQVVRRRAAGDSGPYEGAEAPTEDTVYPEWSGEEDKRFEKQFQEGVSSIMNYDINKAREAVKRDE